MPSKARAIHAPGTAEPERNDVAPIDIRTETVVEHARTPQITPAKPTGMA